MTQFVLLESNAWNRHDAAQRPLYFRVVGRKVVATPDTLVPTSPTFLLCLGFILRNNTLVPFWQGSGPIGDDVKHRVCLAILSAALLSSLAVAQMPSRFDLSANGSLGNAQLVGAPSGSQLRSFGWQTTGISHFTSWLGMSSQFSGGYANANGIQLIGYTGSGKIQRYSS